MTTGGEANKPARQEMNAPNTAKIPPLLYPSLVFFSNTIHSEKSVVKLGMVCDRTNTTKTKIAISEVPTMVPVTICWNAAANHIVGNMLLYLGCLEKVNWSTEEWTRPRRMFQAKSHWMWIPLHRNIKQPQNVRLGTVPPNGCRRRRIIQMDRRVDCLLFMKIIIEMIILFQERLDSYHQ